MFANCQLMGMDLAFPDVCRTPVPVPFPNMALGPMAIPERSRNILLHGDARPQPGNRHAHYLGRPAWECLRGVVSQTFMQQSRHLTGAFTVLLKADARLRDG